MAVSSNSDGFAQRAGDQDRRERLSALIDGEADAAALDESCLRWRDDDALRNDWSVYHLIGDVMRSDELAASGTRSDAFLDALRGRLDAEPVVLAPAAVVRPRGQRLRLRALRNSFAVAAGVAAVGGLAWMLNPALMTSGDSSSIAAAGAGPNAAGGATVPVRLDAAPPAGNGLMLRDREIDRYLSAHQQLSGSGSMLGGVGELRPAAVTSTTDSSPR